MNTLKQKLDNEMQEFKKAYDTMTPTQVYNDWYIISFYESYYEMLTFYIEEEDDKISDILEWLDTFKSPLRFLYNRKPIKKLLYLYFQRPSFQIIQASKSKASSLSHIKCSHSI